VSLAAVKQWVEMAMFEANKPPDLNHDQFLLCCWQMSGLMSILVSGLEQAVSIPSVSPQGTKPPMAANLGLRIGKKLISYPFPNQD
jgi:hypothetical protein